MYYLLFTPFYVLFIVVFGFFKISDEDLLKITEKWFGQLDTKPIPLILSVMKQPFKDLRYASLDIFLQLSPQFWAQKIMSQQPGADKISFISLKVKILN